jgi:PTH1 family peptidyl-tRNA hydrolase
VLEHFAATNSFSSWHEKSAYSGRISEGRVGDEEVVLLLPQTFMNDSGSAVKKLVKKGEEEKLIVVYDDVDLPFGEIKLSFARGNGGHNGVRSIIDSLGTQDFIRVRIGVAQKSFFTGSLKRPKGEALAQFVLQKFSRGETKQLPEVLTKVREKAMNLHN